MPSAFPLCLGAAEERVRAGLGLVEVALAVDVLDPCGFGLGGGFLVFIGDVFFSD